MVVGILRLRLHLPGAQSLHDRQRVTRKICERVRARFNVSIADVGSEAEWRVATIAVTAVSNEHAHANEMLDKVAGEIANTTIGVGLISGHDLELTSYNDDTPLAGDDYTPMAKGAFPTAPPRRPRRR
jgi:uncharacterized protein YlxP (DUF503 family)